MKRTVYVVTAIAALSLSSLAFARGGGMGQGNGGGNRTMASAQQHIGGNCAGGGGCSGAMQQQSGMQHEAMDQRMNKNEQIMNDGTNGAGYQHGAGTGMPATQPETQPMNN